MRKVKTLARASLRSQKSPSHSTVRKSFRGGCFKWTATSVTRRAMHLAVRSRNATRAALASAEQERASRPPPVLHAAPQGHVVLGCRVARHAFLLAVAAGRR